MAYRPRNRVVGLIVWSLVVVLPDNCRSGWNPEDCPNFCECFPLYDLRWTECAGRHLYSIHTGVNEAVQALDLSNNSIASLADYELREAGLTNLKLLNLTSNAISEIGMSAFVGLADLRVLDLSNNHLYYVQTNSFVGNRRLEVLELAGNNFNGHVPNLRSVSVASLGLARCRISHLPLTTFDKLPRLRAIDLSDNVMILLEPGVLLKIPHLAILVVDRNPWFCNKDMFELQNRLKHNGVEFKEMCTHSEIRSSKTGPKMFEKMIALDSGASSGTGVGGTGRLLARIKNRPNSWKPEATSNRGTTRVPADSTTGNSVRTTTSGTGLSGYFFLAMGFIAGAAVATVATYTWMAGELSRSLSNNRRRAMREDMAQRMSLLQHLWQNSENTSRSTTAECPGTPPPPYRDVMLHARRYPRPHIQAILFANDSTIDNQRQVH